MKVIKKNVTMAVVIAMLCAGVSNASATWVDFGSSSYAVAGGNDVKASGYGSTALGTYSYANSGSNATAIGCFDIAGGAQSTAIGSSNTTSEDLSTALGNGNTVQGEGSTGVGSKNTVKGKNSVAVGANNKFNANNAMVLGNNVTTVANNSVVLGNGSSSEAENTVSVGTTGSERKIVHVADGTDDHDAATYGQVKTVAENLNTVAQNLNTNIANVQTQLVDTIKVVQTNIETNLKGVETMAKDGLYKANQKIDTNAGNIKQNQQDIAANKAAIETEVADRKAEDEKLQKNIEAEAATREAEDTKLQESIAAETANRVAADNALNSRISQVETDANKGIAKASALAALHPLDYDPNNKFDVAAAGGFYKGENAFALGAFYRPSRNVMLSLATTVSGGDNAYNVGVTFKVGKSGKEKEAGVSTAELYAMISAMQKRIEELEAAQGK